MDLDGAGLRLRAWEPADAPGVLGLLDAGADHLWVMQGHALHGPARDGERWRRTTVAELDGAVVGAATAARNRVHPDRFSCAVDVHPAWRRRGIGRRLLAAVRTGRSEGLPLTGKLRPWDAAATGFLAAAGGSVRQRCPGQVVDLDDPGLLAWAEQHDLAAAAPPGLETGSLERLGDQHLAQAFAEQYLWVHAPWSPVPPGAPRRALAEVAVATAAEVDRARSSGVWWRGRLVATVLVFPSTRGWEAVAETVVPQVRAVGVPARCSGVEVLRSALARTLVQLARHGDERPRRLELDGHVDDPHLQPALAGLPVVELRPLLLVLVP